MKYPDPIPATPAPFLSDILRRGLQMDPRRAGENARTHLFFNHRAMSPTSALARAWRTRDEPSGWTAATRAHEAARIAALRTARTAAREARTARP